MNQNSRRALLGRWMEFAQGYQGGGYPVSLYGQYPGLYGQPGYPAPQQLPQLPPPPLPMAPLPPPSVGQAFPMDPYANCGPVVLPQVPYAVAYDSPLPTATSRWILPMSSGVPILPCQQVQITGRPQTQLFQVNGWRISNAGTAGGAADWIVNNILIGNRSQLAQSGDVPGDVFATNAIDSYVTFESAQTAMDIAVVVTYIGCNESGVPFYSAMFGVAARGC